jgi:phosphatidylglycerophosphate synthase
VLITVVVVGVCPDDRGDLAGTLAQLGLTAVHMAPNDSPERLPTCGRTVLVDGRWVGHTHALRLVAFDQRPGIRVAGGLLGVGAHDRDRVVAAAQAVGSLYPDAVREALTHDGVATADVVSSTQLVSAAPVNPEARARVAQAAIEIDEEALRLAGAVKAHDGFFTTFFVSPYSRYLARWFARHGWRPNHVTVLSMLVALVASALCATGERSGYVAGALLLQASFTLDCVDGQLARYTLDFSRVGAWLDATFDRAKEYVLFAGLAIGSARTGTDVWLLAGAAMSLQTVRHSLDFAFNASVPGSDPDSPMSSAARLSTRLDTVGWSVWARRMVILPIGERWALISVLVALTSPRTAFVVLLVAGGLAGAYSLTGRVLRSQGRTTSPQTASQLRPMADGGELARLAAATRLGALPASPLTTVGVAALTAALIVTGSTVDAGAALLAGALVYVVLAGAGSAGRLTGPLAWLVVPLVRAGEYGATLALTAVIAPHALPAAFALLAAVAYHHYDTVYRLRGDAAPPPRLVVALSGGHDGRVLLLCALALAGAATLRPGLVVAAALIAAVVTTESVRTWTRPDTARAGRPLDDAGDLA